MNHKFMAILHKEEDMFVADCPEVGTVSQGYTRKEAIANLKEATEAYLEVWPKETIFNSHYAEINMKKETDFKLLEKEIKKLDYPTPESLWKVVKRKVSLSDFDRMLGYLLRTHHILINRGAIVWTWNPQLADRIFLNRELLIK